MKNEISVIFSHGKESGPFGKKIQYLMDICRNNDIANIISIDYTHTLDPDERVEILIEQAKEFKNVILVGSSMGGYVSIVASETINPLGIFLLAPAVYLPNYKRQEFYPKFQQSHIVYGYKDEIIPFENVVSFSKKHNFPLTLINSDHRLDDHIGYIGEIFDLFLSKIINQ